jgi:hypothetical protein
MAAMQAANPPLTLLLGEGTLGMIREKLDSVKQETDA